MSIRSPEDALTSEPSFDVLPENVSFSTHCQTVNIAKWRENIQDPATSAQDLFFFSNYQALNHSDALDLKDNASERSMDSAYQSQSSDSRPRAPKRSEGHQMLPPQDSRTQMTNHFTGNDLASPVLSADTFTLCSEPRDTSRLHLPVSMSDMETGHNWLTDAFSAQNYSSFSNTPTHTSSHTTPFSTEFHWGTADSPALDATMPFSHMTSDQGLSMAMSMLIPSQQQQRGSLGSMSAQPTSTHNVPSSVMSDPRRTSTHMANLETFVSSPVVSQSHIYTDMEFEQQLLLQPSVDLEQVTSPPNSQFDDQDDEAQMDSVDTKRLEEEHNRTHRTDPLYQATPGEDGQYHCPHEGQGVCNHRPTNLKCNYDKYIDSHLKPFRCSRKSCSMKEFSSTACLLRHEREAHGMHGHGSRPHLCEFPACERAQEGNGFPRRYNLYDHMKRVHDYHGPTTDQTSPPKPGRVTNTRKPTSRKRKLTEEDASSKRQKPAEATRQQRLEQKRLRTRQEFDSKKQSIVDFLNELKGPNELKSMQARLTAHVQELCELSAAFGEGFDGSHGG